MTFRWPHIRARSGALKRRKNISDKRKRNKKIFTRVTDEEQEIAFSNAKSRGMTMGQYLREIALAGKPVQSKKRNMDTHALVVKLGPIASNINQMTKVANTMGLIENAPLIAVLNELRQTIRDIR
ncbi:MAG: plasmid mobilization protein [Alphaproteobacteria bacterium]|jgi:hypothetical protein